MARSFDPKTVNQLDWGILGAGVLAFIFSFVSWYTYDEIGCGRFGGVSASDIAWSGFFALVRRAARRWSGRRWSRIELFMPHVKLPFPNRLIGARSLRARHAAA